MATLQEHQQKMAREWIGSARYLDSKGMHILAKACRDIAENVLDNQYPLDRTAPTVDKRRY